MIRISLFAALFATFQGLFGQKAEHQKQIYRIQPTLDYPLCVSIGLIGGGSQIAAHGLRPFSPSDVAPFSLAGAELRFAERNRSVGARHFSDFLALGGGATAATICFRQADSRKERLTNFVMLGETFGLNLFLTETAKNGARATRPYVLNPTVSVGEKTKLDARKSFFSGHTSTAAAMTFFSAKVWSDRHPNSPARRLVWAGAAAYPMAVGFLRMAAGQHYFRDVSVGFAVGAAVGWAIPELHRRAEMRRRAKLAERVGAAF